MTGTGDFAPSSSEDVDVDVDRILSVLDQLDHAPVADHAALYLDVHDRLSRELMPEQPVRGAGAHGSP